MKERLLTLTWMTVVWVALWGDISVANVLGGVAVASVILLLVPPRGKYSDLTFRPFHALSLFVYFLWKLVESSTVVAWEILTPADRLKRAIVAVPLRTRSKSLSALVANMVTLTPGTLTIELQGDPPVLYIHVVYRGSLESACDGVSDLEDRVLRAFGPGERGPDGQDE